MSLESSVNNATRWLMGPKPLGGGHASFYGSIDVGKDLCHACCSEVR